MNFQTNVLPRISTGLDFNVLIPKFALGL